MLLTLYHLPQTFSYMDLKQLLRDKCGLTDVIFDNMRRSGPGTKKVNIGLSDVSDAQIVMREVNGIYLGGNQIVVENIKQKQGTEPYQNSNRREQQSSSLYAPGRAKNCEQQYNTSYPLPKGPVTQTNFSMGWETNNQFVSQDAWDKNEPSWEISANSGPSPHVWDRKPVDVRAEVYNNDVNFNNDRAVFSFNQNDQFPQSNYNYNEFKPSNINHQQHYNPVDHYDQARGYNNFQPNPVVQPRSAEPMISIYGDHVHGPLLKTPRRRVGQPSSQRTIEFKNSNRSNQHIRSDRRNSDRYSNQREPNDSRSRFENQPRDRTRFIDQGTVRKPRFEDRSGTNKPRSMNPASRRDAKYPSGPARAEKRPYAAPQKSVPIVKKPKQLDETDITKVIGRDEAWRGSTTGHLTREVLALFESTPVNVSILKKSLNKAIRTRIDLLLKDELAVPFAELLERYRKKYTLDDDVKLAESIIAAQETPKSTVKSENPVKKEPKSSAVKSDLTWIPKHQNSDKRAFFQLKKQNEREWAQDKPYVLEPGLQKAADEEVEAIGKLILESIVDPDDAESVLQKKLPKIAAEVKRISAVLLARRILDVRAFLTVRITCGPKKPKRDELAAFFKKHGVSSFRQANYSKVIVAICDSYEDYDQLCALKQATLGSNTLRFKPMHLSGPPIKPSRAEVLKERQDFINSQICDYDLPNDGDDVIGQDQADNLKQEKDIKNEDKNENPNNNGNDESYQGDEKSLDVQDDGINDTDNGNAIVSKDEEDIDLGNINVDDLEDF